MKFLRVTIPLLLVWLTLRILVKAQIQDVTIVLSQGTIVGLKVFPETSRIPVFTYLGIPYAKPPVDDLRFAPPVPSPGWNRTLYARDFKPICPQLENNSYDDVDPLQYKFRETSEDCLYLNIWMPETAIRYGGFPILVILTGEEMAFDWSVNRATGLDLASDGIIVVTVQYRSNIFGWLSLGKKYAPGNLGLLDQQLALVWIKDNIQKFGGDTNRITLLGHGTTAGPNVMTHMVSPKARGLFSKTIIMSGTIFSPYTRINTDRSLSEKLVQILACNYDVGRNVLKCLQQKSVHDVLKAFEYVYSNGNYTIPLGPIVDDYLEPADRYVPDDPRALFSSKSFIIEDMPVMFGITSNEGSFMLNKWVDFARQGPDYLKAYINDSLIPNIMKQYDFGGVGQQQIRETIGWRFFDQIPESTPHLLNAIIKLTTETRYEIPFYKTLEVITSTTDVQTTPDNSIDLTKYDLPEHRSNVQALSSGGGAGNLYVYLFHHSNSMDMRGRVNYFGGASHSSDLPFLMGPSLFQEIGRKRFSQSEDKLCRKIRGLFSEFVKAGDPTPGRKADAWTPYNDSVRYIKLISTRGAAQENIFQNDKHSLEHTFEENIRAIEDKLLNANNNQETGGSNQQENPYLLGRNNLDDQESSRSSKSATFVDNTRDSEYFSYLKRIDSFWYRFLPKLGQIMNQTDQERLRNRRIDLSQEEELELYRESSSEAARYKHAFFSMLTLVCMLLAVLCICIYVLKKNTNKSFTSIL
ncbi:acetylcholinesterase [Uranotaenia lowii]|uniref:acetylcholinesterase n=1 Tax=Uranotaenia lowii TaxID=190385 RepID=UPI002478B120|nr:acetylcholinesterase [Uranotaenia lowii]XP_055598454.1 acetylcholinesterase [Uranotaenia lowii]XP_055598455.1 acetylcholinesterase [Uranotaenia lowii]XP_055598456.1 acetylcholinesterase [Uranotaenia lowii]XP_055598457.1 acetylcholinesterase [Uranotaenia lowii]XP_055598458.1 acetylcholinesterase [Uranotaenia lowii]